MSDTLEFVTYAKQKTAQGNLYLVAVPWGQQMVVAFAYKNGVPVDPLELQVEVIGVFEQCYGSATKLGKLYEASDRVTIQGWLDQLADAKTQCYTLDDFLPCLVSLTTGKVFQCWLTYVQLIAGFASYKVEVYGFRGSSRLWDAGKFLLLGGFYYPLETL